MTNEELEKVVEELVRQWREGLVSAEEVLEYLEKWIKKP